MRSRTASVVAVITLFLGTLGGLHAQEVTLIAAGDIEWSRAVKPPSAYIYQPDDEVEIAVRGVPSLEPWTAVPYLNRRAHWPEIAERSGRQMIGAEMDHPSSHHRAAIIYPLEFASEEDESRYPFQLTRDLLRSADITFANLEMPLSDRARHTGAFLGKPVFADALRWAGVDVVSVANNHAFDAEELGLLDTMAALEKAGVGYVGGGTDLAHASTPHVIEVDGISLAFLGYTYGVNVVEDWGFANADMSGVLPLDPILIKEHIRAIRDNVDYVAVSLHWAIENAKRTHSDARAFAQDLIDEGADIILGHHPHVPRGVEMYNGGVIFYSLGNFVFGHNHTYWGDNYLTQIAVGPDRITGVEVIPISGQGNDMSQPYVLTGHRAQVLLEKVRDLSGELGTELEIVGDRGFVRP